MEKLESSVRILSDRIRSLLERKPNEHRILIAVAGIPGSGKSTITTVLVQALRTEGVEGVNLLPMDGFHFSKADLSSFQDPELAFRKRGAPFTFDAVGIIELLTFLRSAPITQFDESDKGIWIPSFDHAVQDPVKDSIFISSADRIVIVEGNYLLLDEPPWNKIASLVDEKWFVNVPADAARHRLIERHVAAGIERTKEAAGVRVDDNDMANAYLIRKKLIAPDLIIEN